MKIVVLVKQVPDTSTERTMDTATGVLDRAASDAVTSEIDERALALALRLREEHGGDITVLTMGPERATDALRRCLAAGADAAVHVLDPRLAGSDAFQTATTLAAALRTVDFDLVVSGCESTDGKMGVVPAMIAELLRLPQASFLRSLEVTDGSVLGERVEGGTVVAMRAALPCLVSVTEEVAEPKHPNLKGIMAAKKKPLTTIGLDELGIDGAGLAHARTTVLDVAARPPRSGGHVIHDEGAAGAAIADFLAGARLI